MSGSEFLKVIGRKGTILVSKVKASVRQMSFAHKPT